MPDSLRVIDETESKDMGQKAKGDHGARGASTVSLGRARSLGGDRKTYSIKLNDRWLPLPGEVSSPEPSQHRRIHKVTASRPFSCHLELRK
jgi:hypothetical protein